MAETTVCVAGASGLVGANITARLLAGGYQVHGTMRDPQAQDKASYLQALSSAECLSLYQAEMAKNGSFDEALVGADCVFVACLIPTYFAPDGTPARELDDARGYPEIIMPTVNGCLNILRSAHRCGVRNVVICSSTSSTNPLPDPEIKNELDHWSDADQQCNAKKYTSAAKTVMEEAAMAFTEEHGMRLCTFLPSMIAGPPLLPSHLQPGLMKLLRGERWHERMPNDSMSMIDVRDLAALMVAAYENPEASGRYFGVRESWHWQDIYAELARQLPDAPMPERLSEPAVPATKFDHTRTLSLGVPLRDIPAILADTIAAYRPTLSG